MNTVKPKAFIVANNASARGLMPSVAICAMRAFVGCLRSPTARLDQVRRITRRRQNSSVMMRSGLVSFEAGLEPRGAAGAKPKPSAQHP
jgi:hypothetical protein